MYGTIMRARVKDGRKAEYERTMKEMVPSAEEYGRGLHSIEVAWEDNDPQRIVMIIHFRDRESYIANANRPETDTDYRRQLEFLDGEPACSSRSPSSRGSTSVSFAPWPAPRTRSSTPRAGRW